MAKIVTKYNTSAAASPPTFGGASGLTTGELAVNVAQRRVFIGGTVGTVELTGVCAGDANTFGPLQTFQNGISAGATSSFSTLSADLINPSKGVTIGSVSNRTNIQGVLTILNGLEVSSGYGVTFTGPATFSHNITQTGTIRGISTEGWLSVSGGATFNTSVATDSITNRSAGTTFAVSTRNNGTTKSNLNVVPVGDFIVAPSPASAAGGTPPKIVVQSTDNAAGQVQVSGGNLYLGTKTTGAGTTTSCDVVFGNANNAFTTTVTAPNTATSSKTITLPNTTGTIVVDAAANTFTALNTFTSGLCAAGEITFNGVVNGATATFNRLLTASGGLSAAGGVTFSGSVNAPTPANSNSSTLVATTAFVYNNAVTRLNGITGGITLNGTSGISITQSIAGGITISGSGFAGANTVVTSFNGITGAVQGVSAMNGMTGAVRFTGGQGITNSSGNGNITPRVNYRFSGITFFGDPDRIPIYDFTMSVRNRDYILLQAHPDNPYIESFTGVTNCMYLSDIDRLKEYIVEGGMAPMGLPTGNSGGYWTNGVTFGGIVDFYRSTYFYYPAFFLGGLCAAGGITFNGTVNGTTASFSRIVTLSGGLSAAGGITLASPSLTGTPTSTTAAIGTNTTQIATTAFVQSEIIADTVTSFNGRTGSVQGVSAAVAGDGISVSGATGSVTITNAGVTRAVAGTGISVTANTGTVTIANTGVLSFNGAVGAVTGASLGANTFTGLQTSSTGFSGPLTGTATNASSLGGVAAASYALLASPTFTGTPAAPTAAIGTNTTQIATTAFVQNEIVADAVTSFNGRTGAVQGVSAAVAGTGISVSGATGAVTITNIGVQSFNGATGAVTGASLGANTFSGVQNFAFGILVSTGATFSNPTTIAHNLTQTGPTRGISAEGFLYVGGGATFNSTLATTSIISPGATLTIQPGNLGVANRTLRLSPYGQLIIDPALATGSIGGSTPRLVVQNADNAAGQFQFSGGNVYLGTKTDSLPSDTPVNLIFGNPTTAFTTTLTAPNTATSSKTITLPNATGTMVVDGAANTFTALQSFTAGISASGGVTFANALSVAGTLNSTGLLNSTGGISASGGVTFNTPIVSTRLPRTSSGVFDTKTADFSPSDADNGKVFVINISGKTTVTVTLEGLSTGWRAKFLVLGGTGVSFISTSGTVLGTYGVDGAASSALTEMVEVYCYGSGQYFAG